MIIIANNLLVFLFNYMNDKVLVDRLLSFESFLYSRTFLFKFEKVGNRANQFLSYLGIGF